MGADVNIATAQCGKFTYQLLTILRVRVVRFVITEKSVDRLEWANRLGGIDPNDDGFLCHHGRYGEYPKKNTHRPYP